MNIDVQAADDAVAERLADELARVADVASKQLVLPRELSVAVVDDAAMIELHRRSHGLATTTDALTYELDRDGDRVTEGEVIICLDVAHRQAAQRGHDVATELLLYALHGLLHLCGYDDTTDTLYRQMHALEDNLLDQAGFGRPFASGSAVG